MNELGQSFRGLEPAVESSGNTRALGRAEDRRWETTRLWLP